ncbi:MAG: glycosyltransferase [Conexivisphaerales archaeon]
MSSWPEVSVIMVTYNAMPLIMLVEHAIKSILSAEYSNFRTIVVDNGSNDGTAEYLQEKFSRELFIYKSPVNIGFAKGNNIG